MLIAKTLAWRLPTSWWTRVGVRRAPEWLQVLGYSPSAETTVNSFLAMPAATMRSPNFRSNWAVGYQHTDNR
jgi:hypothetical protein